jgi:hypothetical protein
MSWPLFVGIRHDSSIHNPRDITKDFVIMTKIFVVMTKHFVYFQSKN